MNLEDIQAVISSAKARGREPLVRFIEKRVPDASEEELQEVADVAVEVIETVPILLARAAQEAEERSLTNLVNPLLEEAEAYFLSPMDLIPEMTQGLAGLLDDTYLVLRILQNLNRGDEPLLQTDLTEPLAFIRNLVGPKVVEKLDRAAIQAAEQIEGKLTALWAEMGAEA